MSKDLFRFFFSAVDGSRYVGLDIGSFSEGFRFRRIR